MDHRTSQYQQKVERLLRKRINVFCNTLVTAFLVGVAPAVQGLVARRRGERAKELKCRPLNAGLVAAVLLGVPLTIAGWFFAPAFLSAINHDPRVVHAGIPFLRTLYLGLVASGMGLAFKGHWNGMERPKIYMGIVLFVNVLNFLGDYVLIQGRWGFPV